MLLLPKSFTSIKRFVTVKTNYNRPILCTEYPKSGGTWLCNLIKDASGVPFPKGADRITRNSLLHGHYLNFATKKNIIIWRDPLDIAVSYYHHVFFRTNLNARQLKDTFQRDLLISEHNDIKKNIGLFFEHIMTCKSYPRYSFIEFFNKNYGRPDCFHLTYAGLKTNPELILRNLFNYLEMEISKEKIENSIKMNTFSSKTGRKDGKEDKQSSLRKGIVGDHKNYFEDAYIVSAHNRFDKVFSKLSGC